METLFTAHSKIKKDKERKQMFIFVIYQRHNISSLETEGDRLSNPGWDLLYLSWTEGSPLRQLWNIRAQIYRWTAALLMNALIGITTAWLLILDSCYFLNEPWHDSESCSIHLQSGRESGHVIGHLINKQGKLELILLVTASAERLFPFWHRP